MVSVPFKSGTPEYATLDMAINSCLESRPSLPIVSTDNDAYHNPALYGFVGPSSYDVGTQCARALLFTTPGTMGTEAGLDIILGRKKPPAHPLAPVNDLFPPNGVVHVYSAPGSEGNDALTRRLRGLNATLSEYGASASAFHDHSASFEGRIVTLSGAWGHHFDPDSHFICGDELYGSTVPQAPREFRDPTERPRFEAIPTAWLPGWLLALPNGHERGLDGGRCRTDRPLRTHVGNLQGQLGGFHIEQHRH